MNEKFPQINDGFNFACTLCGDCCRGEQEVLLNWYDLYKMAQYLGFGHTADLFAKGWVELVRDKNQTVWRPRIRFKEKPLRFCPFLINELQDDGQLKGYCQLHPGHKPLVCALAPVGCRYDSETKRTDFILVPPTEDCPGMQSQQWNDLQAYLRPFKEELNFQSLFFEVMEQLKNRNCRREQYEKIVFSFPVKETFAAALQVLRGQLQQAFNLTWRS